MLSKVRRCFRWLIGIILNILIVLVTIFIIIGIYYLFQIKILNKGYANLFGYTFFQVATGSMSDTIEIGDVIIVRITKEIEENDIIVYKEEENYITHRLILKNEEELIAKGDANNSEDKPIKLEQVLGKVEIIIPKIGMWRDIIMTPEIIGLIIVVIVLLSFVFFYNKNGGKDE